MTKQHKIKPHRTWIAIDIVKELMPF